MKKALITGVTGQDGAYLAEWLLSKDYEVHGLKRRTSLINTGRIDHLYQDPQAPDRRFILHYGDMTDSVSLARVLETVRPDEIYNLAAQSHVAVSFEAPEYTADADAVGTLRLLEAMRTLGMVGSTRLVQASTSEMFGRVQEVPQSESTPFYPRSPYGVAKLYAYWIVVNYREAYGMFACNSIMFNHESPLRGETFVTRKITRGLAEIAIGRQQCLHLGNLNARRDWGHARDYVRAQWMMLQQPEPEDFVIATGEQHSVREFVEQAAAELGVTLSWRGRGAEEEGVVTGVDPAAMEGIAPDLSPAVRAGAVIVRVSDRYLRPTEVDSLLGDAGKAREKLGWRPEISFAQLVREMVHADLRHAARDKLAQDHGFATYASRE